ncbi:MAG: hypothetical protein NTV54_11730 [Ignavibacteriales bacterium]|nr:hypothetical protein [Ignavibacteriales bacterium]
MEQQKFSLGIAWNWEFDADFVYGLEYECLRAGMTSYRVEPHNLQETLRRLRGGELCFDAFLDRASDAEESFEPLARLLAKSKTLVLNRYESLIRARDKATMHLALLEAGIPVPYSIIISPYSKKQEIGLSLSELAGLGRPFIIKPANTTGGGVGVVLGAESLKDIIETRKHHQNDKYLLQQKILPGRFGNSKGWFRVLYVCGIIIPCWWDDETHIYRLVTKAEEVQFHLAPLRRLMKKIAQVCRLDFFSSEIARDTKSGFVVIDYVNEVCDMRLQSAHVDGVPDSTILQIQQILVHHALNGTH